MQRPLFLLLGGNFVPQFKNTKDLLAYIRKAVDLSLNTEVFDAVKKTELTAIQEDVYDAYTPHKYVRRKARGGLLDQSHIVKAGGVAKNGILIVANITPPNPYLNGINNNDGISTTPSNSTIPALIEYGTYSPYGYGYDYWRRAFPREFIEGTVERLKASGACTVALKRGLIRQGIAVK